MPCPLSRSFRPLELPAGTVSDLRPVERGYIDLRPQYGLGHGDRNLNLEVSAVAVEIRVGLDGDRGSSSRRPVHPLGRARLAP